MKEIKAYVRRSKVNPVVEALLQAGAPGITVVEIHPVGNGYEPSYFDLRSEEDVIRRYRLNEVVKVELVCADRDLEPLLQTLLQGAKTGARGDGMIFVSEVSRAIRIRDGASGEESLGKAGKADRSKHRQREGENTR